MSTDNYLALQSSRALEAVAKFLPCASSRPTILNEAIRYAVLSGGKCLRPIFVLTAADAVSSPEGSLNATLQAAAAIEYLHSYTLIHDDLPSMDNDVLRRGKPTVHIAFGEAVAILAGDALQALAFDVISRPTNLSATRSLRLVQTLASAAGPAGVIAGQVEDIASTSLNEERLSYIQLHKTADLFRTALSLGAIAGGGFDSDVQTLALFGQHLGIAFQIIDDLLDANDPAKADETSCLRLYSPTQAKHLAKQFTSNAIASLAPLQQNQATIALASLAESMLSRLI